MSTQISKTVGADGDGAVHPQGLVLKHRHKWFAHTSSEAENGWSGPHEHIEDAARAALLALESEGDTCWIAQGRKLTKMEYEEQGAEYTWEVDTFNAMKLVLPKKGARQELVDISHYENQCGQIGRFGSGWPVGPMSLMWVKRPNE